MYVCAYVLVLVCVCVCAHLFTVTSTLYAVLPFVVHEHSSNARHRCGMYSYIRDLLKPDGVVQERQEQEEEEKEDESGELYVTFHCVCILDYLEQRLQDATLDLLKLDFGEKSVLHGKSGCK